MNPIIEKVARAIVESIKKDGCDGYAEEEGTEEYPLVIDAGVSPAIIASAAIRATLEHLRDNVSEGMEAIGWETDPNWKYTRDGSPREVFSAMLSQALAEIDA